MTRATLAGLVALAACASDATGPGGLSILTDRSAYEAEYLAGGDGRTIYGFTVVAELRNTTRGTVHLERCSPSATTPIWGIASVDEGVRPGWGYAWACVGTTTIAMSPGESRTDTLRVIGPTSYDGVTKEPLGVLEGSFRLVYAMRPCAGSCSSDWTLGSNAFRVTLAPAP